MNGNQRYHQRDYHPDKTPPPQYVYPMGQNWYTVRLPNKWVGVFFGIENAVKAKRQALDER